MRPSVSSFHYSSEQHEKWLDPLAHTILKLGKPDETVIIGIQGGQGTGKTTLADYLVHKLSEEKYRAISFSIDDFYMSHEERKLLAAKYAGNPFYHLSRGMPGTHRIDALYTALCNLKNGRDIVLPVFDKSAYQGKGDISDYGTEVKGRQDFVVFEGWCIGMPAVTSEELLDACKKHLLQKRKPLPAKNHLETVLLYLSTYQRLWNFIDFLIMLYPDSPHLHEHWRLRQEKELAAHTGAGMPEEQLINMIHYFLPLTCLCYEKIKPDLRMHINKEHCIYKASTS